MKRGLALVFIFLIGLSLSARGVRAEQVEYLSFDHLHFYEQDVNRGANGISITFSLPSRACLAGVVVKTGGVENDADITIEANGKALEFLRSSPEVTAWPTQAICSDTFTIYIDIIDSVDQSGTVYYAYVYKVILITNNEYRIVKSRISSAPKYIPPGAEDTPQGLLLNRTEVLLSQSHTLSEGTIAFWLKWDGTKNIKLSDNIGIDGNGYIYIKSDDTTYTLEGVSPPIGQYVPVYVGWRNGEGYMMLNTTIVKLNWRGNLVISKVGDLSDDSATIIDEFKLWNTYIPPDQIVYESKKEGYTLLWHGKAITITPEAGTDLGTLDVAFLTDNLTTINSTTLSPGSKSAVVPDETALVVISRSGVSRRYWLGNYTEIAFPAENVQLVSSTISIRPTVWQYLTLKTPDGRVATRVKLDSTQTARVMTVLGSDYIISLENRNTTKSMLYTITGDVSLWVESDTARYQGKYLTTQLNDKNKLLIITYYDQSTETQELHISVKAYDANNNMKYEINDIAVEGPIAYYRLALPVANDSDVMRYKVILNADGQVYERTVFGEAGGGSVLPSNIVPSGLVIFGAGVVGALMFIAINAYLMPFGALIALSAVKFLGWANVPPSVLGMLGVFSTLAMLMYRRDQGVG